MSKIQLNGWQDCRIAISETTTSRWFSCEISPFSASAAAAADMADQIATEIKGCLGEGWFSKRSQSSNGKIDIEFISANVTPTVEIRTARYQENWDLKLDVNLGQ